MDYLQTVINTGTTGEDLLRICYKLKLPFFKGVYSSDYFPDFETLGSSFCIIINTHPSTEPGEHWVLLLGHKNKLMISDSLRLSKKQYIAKLGQVVRQFNIYPLRKNKVQHNESLNCGLFVLHDVFLFHLKIFKKNSNMLWKYRKRACKLNDKICICNINKMLQLIKQ